MSSLYEDIKRYTKEPKITRERQGELFMLMETLTWSCFPIITQLMFHALSPLGVMFYSMLFTLLFFAIVLLFRPRSSATNFKKAMPSLLLTSLFITLLFIFVYTGLEYTSANNAALILFLQLFFSYFYFHVIGKAPMHYVHVGGALLMAIGALSILLPGKLQMNKGDLFILLAALIAPLANLFQKKTRKYLQATEILFLRTLFAIPFLALLLFSSSFSSPHKPMEVIWLVLLNGFFFFGVSKLFWIEAIYRISITKASALGALSPMFTIFFSYTFMGYKPSMEQILAGLCIILGGFILTRQIKSS